MVEPTRVETRKNEGGMRNMETTYNELSAQAELAVSQMKDTELRRVAIEKVFADLLLSANASSAPRNASGRQTGEDALEREYETYKVLLDLWKSENPIKTNKLQVLLAVNALLVSGLKVSGQVIARENWLVYLAGALFSVIWTLSMGRTALFQEIWQMKLTRLQDRRKEDPRFQVLDTRIDKRQAARLLRWFGCVSSRWYLLFSPFGFAAAWLLLLAASLYR